MPRDSSPTRVPRLLLAWVAIPMVCLLALAGKAALDWEYERVKAAAAAVAAANDAKAQELWEQFRAARDALFAKKLFQDSHELST
jgi:hypothetical protein